MAELHPESLAWTALLGRWMDFARASLALPDDAEGNAWRDSVTDIITLQAVTFALAELSSIPADDRDVSRDRASWLIERHAGNLDTVWRGMPMPEMMLEMLDDAKVALRRSVYAGAVELVYTGSSPMVMEAVGAPGEATWFMIMQPGTIVMPNEPVAWWIDSPGIAIADCSAEPNDRPRQVYRQLNDAGQITGDLVLPVDAASPPGVPLLVPLRAGGESVGSFTMNADDWLARQRAAMTGDEIPVEHGE
ncbi:MAG: hypothetical protein AAF432_14185 [Planctomycetota bacterium]